METEGAVSLLVYGSYAAEATDADSDVDLICVTRGGGARHLLMNFGDAVLDIYAGPRALLEQAIRADNRANNNFVLTAFAHGRPLAAGDGGAEALANLARAVWEAGPARPDLQEQRALAVAVRKAAVAAKRFAVRADESPERRGVVNVNMSGLFVQVVHAYCRVHRLWASTLSDMLSWTGPQYLDLIAMCRRYVRAELFEERSAALCNLAEVTLGRIDFEASAAAAGSAPSSWPYAQDLASASHPSE